MSAHDLITRAKQSSGTFGMASTQRKNEVLQTIAKLLTQNLDAILRANHLDLDRGRDAGLAEGLLDRLELSEKRVTNLSRSVLEVVALPDPIGEVVAGRLLPNGLRISQLRVPFGLVGVIYEARPNVTVDIAALALKSGNAIVLRGGSAAEKTNEVLVGLIQNALELNGFSRDLVATVDPFGREGAVAMMQARGLVDVLIPRGSAQLIKTVVTESRVPVIETGDGVVHLFVDETADLETATPVIINSKVQRPSVCNSLETLLVHQSVAEELLPQLSRELSSLGVTLHGCERSMPLMPGATLATDADWATEYLALELSVRIVDSIDDALNHIAKYSTRHTESILTQDMRNAERFLAEVDSAVVMLNASTRFTDGGEFGFGAEVGISTQKLHARGPMGLNALTSTKWQVRGNGQVRS